MTNVIQTVYPKDLTMKLASNHIERETKEFTTAEGRIFVPDGGPFYSQSLIIKDSNGKLLKPQIEYKLLYLNEQATLDSGRDVVSVIWVIPETITGVELDYRVVGGEYGNTVNAIMQEIHAAGPIQKNVDWNINVYGKPSQFPPAPHYHTPDTFTGWNTIYEQLEGIRKAIISGDDVSWEAHYNYINRLINTVESNLNTKFINYPTLTQMNAAIAALDFSVDLSGYYTKTQTNSLLTDINTTIGSVSGSLSSNYYTKSQGDSRYAYKSDSYTKAQSDAKYGLINDYYTKSQSDNKYLTSNSLNPYQTTVAANAVEVKLDKRIDDILGEMPDAADLSNYYTKSQTYGKTEIYNKNETYSKVEINTNIYNKVQSDNRYYTKTESDDLFIKLAKLQEEMGKIGSSSEAYKVGDVYLTTINHGSSSAVRTHLGYGTWTRYAEGRAIVGMSTKSSDPSDYKTMGREFGENQHTLTEPEMPIHDHGIGGYGGTSGGGGSAAGYDRGVIAATRKSGGGEAHNNIQPSKTTGAWLRTA